MSYNISANNINANQVTSNRVNANSFGGIGGGGATIVADRIILGGWLIEASGDGIYVTTPGGIKTKMELIDFRETPIPPTPRLLLTQDNTDDAVVAAGTGDTIST